MCGIRIEDLFINNLTLDRRDRQKIVGEKEVMLRNMIGMGATVTTTRSHWRCSDVKW